MEERTLTDFEHILLGLIVASPVSGYDLKVFFAETPAIVYEPSSGALYPGLRRLEHRGLLTSEVVPSAGRRSRRVYRATPAGQAVHDAWLRAPVPVATIGRDLGTHLMRFVMAEAVLTREEILELLTALEGALEHFIQDMERYQRTHSGPGQHGRLALGHGIAVHRASLAWARTAILELSGPNTSAISPPPT